MNIKDIVLIILVIISIYLLYKTLLFENFDNSSDIINEIDNQYTKDMDVIRNLTDFSKYIIDNNDIFNLPGNNFTFANNITIKGKLKGNKNIKFINKKTKTLDIFPKYIVIPWYNNIIPKGWALCDGIRYTIGSDGNALRTNDETNSILTPDLRSRFIVGASNNATSNITPIPFKSIPGGTEKHKLVTSEIPPHQHKYFLITGSDSGIRYANEAADTSFEIPRMGFDTPLGFYTNTDSYDNATSILVLYPKNYGNGIPGGSKHNLSTSTFGDNIPHENTPRYFALYYIIKL